MALFAPAEEEGCLFPAEMFLSDDDKILGVETIRVGDPATCTVDVHMASAAPELQMINTRAFLRVWPASRYLAQLIVARVIQERAAVGSNAARGLFCPAVELGAGPGLCSIALYLVLSRLGASMDFHVVATDGDPDVLQLLRHNVQRNGIESGLSVRALRWGVDPDLEETLAELRGPVPWVFGSDVTYSEQGSRLLIRTAGQLLQPDGELWLVLSWPRFRQMESCVLESADRMGFDVVYNGPVLAEDQPIQDARFLVFKKSSRIE
mmetsp:Transcript_16912/g.35094  ORF Transcript_16912/g.35094 Transcript_16912/m.35094 type:complete len:265 (-) Transcript_16912:615-1409(-)